MRDLQHNETEPGPSGSKFPVAKSVRGKIAVTVGGSSGPLCAQYCLEQRGG